MPDENLDVTRVVKILDHPVRRKIVEILGERGPSSWRQIATEVRTGTGTLYYHLGTLETLVSRDSSKRYQLTKFGEDVYAYMKSNPIGARAPLRTEKSIGDALGRVIRGFFAPQALLTRVSERKTILGVTVVWVSVVLLLFSVYSSTTILLFSFVPSSGLLLSVAGYLGSLLAVTAISYLATLMVFREKSDVLVLLCASSISFLPIEGFACLLQTLSIFGSLGIFGDKGTVTVVLVLFQAWGASLLAAGVSVSSGLRFEKSVLVGPMILYISMVILLAQGRIL